MTHTEREDLASLVERIPCELSIATYDRAKDGSAWLGCQECSRCLLLKYLLGVLDQLRDGIREQILAKPTNGGYELREDLRKRQA